MCLWKLGLPCQIMSRVDRKSFALLSVCLVHAPVVPILGCRLTRQELGILDIFRVEFDITRVTEFGFACGIQKVILQTQGGHDTHACLLIRSQITDSHGITQILLGIIQLRILRYIEINIRVISIGILPENRSIRHALAGNVQKIVLTVRVIRIVLVIIRISDGKIR